MQKRRLDLDLELWPRQLQALNTDATELLFGGATEGGKSHLLRVALITWCLEIPGLQCVLIRKKYDDIIKNHVEGPTGFKVLLAPLINLKLVKVTDDGVRFTHNGSLISFTHCQDERQFTSAQGVEKHVIAIDEATQISERLIKFFRAWCRMPLEMQEKLPVQYRGKFPRIIYTANPIGASLGYFRREFVVARQAFTKEKMYGFIRQYIPSRAQDNLSVDIEAHKGRLAAFDEALAKALDEGDWNSPIGDFFREFNEDLHVVPDFIPPKHWFKYRTFDWGGSDPFATLWFAVSDGIEFMDKGKKLWFPRGALVIYREWYGADKQDPSKGLKLNNEDIAKGILSHTKEDDVDITLADSLPFQSRGGPSIAMIFRDNKVPLTRADTERITGWAHVRDRLIGKDGFPLLYICQSCKFCRDYLPALERHHLRPDDAVEDGEATHICDSIRYGCAAYPIVKDAPVKVSSEIVVTQPTFAEALENTIRRSKIGNRKY